MLIERRIIAVLVEMICSNVLLSSVFLLSRIISRSMSTLLPSSRVGRRIVRDDIRLHRLHTIVAFAIQTGRQRFVERQRQLLIVRRIDVGHVLRENLVAQRCDVDQFRQEIEL